jgi:hypothetical protein
LRKNANKLEKSKGSFRCSENARTFTSLVLCTGGITMKPLTPVSIAVATLVVVVAFAARVPRHAAAQQAASMFVTEIRFRYRDWRLISVAHEEGDLHSFAAVLGNDVAIKAYREGNLLFPDGAIIAALHYRHVRSEENNKVFGRDQSFVAGAPTNIQFMVKDSEKYAATGGWGLVTSKMANLRPTRR